MKIKNMRIKAALLAQKDEDAAVALNCLIDKAEKDGSCRCAACYNWTTTESIMSIAIFDVTRDSGKMSKVPVAVCSTCDGKARKSKENQDDLLKKIHSYVKG